MKIVITIFLFSIYFSLVGQEAARLGSNVSNISLLDIENKPVTLSKFQGKYVFVDFWFTQCKGCVLEFPYAEKLKSELKDENIVFVNISTDFIESFWKESIAKYHLSGENFWVGGVDYFKDPQKLKASRDQLGFSSFPRYWILNTEGLIIDFDASRPSEYMENVDLIDELKSIVSE